MRKLIVLVLVASLACASCLPSVLTGGSGPPTLGPDAPADSETIAPPEEKSGSKIKSGVAWLWACVVALKARGVAHDALAELRATIMDIGRLAAEGSAQAALALFDRARDLAANLRGGE